MVAAGLGAPVPGDEITQKIPALKLEELEPKEITIDMLLVAAREKAAAHTSGEDESIALYRKVLESDPSRLNIWWELAERLQLSGDPDDLVAVLDHIATVAKSDRDRERAYAIMGRVRAVQLGDADLAMESYEKLLRINPAHEEALPYAREYYTQRENWSTLAELYEAALEVRRRHELPFDAATELAELYWQQMGDLRQAERYFKRLRLSDPKNPRMLAFYADYYRREGDYRRLLPTLQSMRSQETDDEVRLELAFEMADVAENKLGQPDRAVDVWKSIYREVPDRPEPAQALKRLYSESGKHNALLEFLKVEAARRRDDEVERKVGYLFEIADLYRDHLKMETMEVNTLAEVLALDPTNEQATATLAAYWERTGNWNDLINLYLGRAEYEEQPQAECEWRRRVVDIWRDNLNSLSQAIPELERIIDLCPDDREALEELREIYAGRDEPHHLLTVLHKQAEQLTGEQQLEVMREMLQVAWKRLADEEETIRIAERILQLSAERDIKTLALLEDLYRERKSFAEVARVLEARRRTATSQAEEIRLLMELGEVVTQQLGDLERGLDLYHQVLTLDPDQEQAASAAINLHVRLGQWDALQDFCASRGEWERLYEILNQAAQQAEDVAIRVDLLSRMANIAAHELADPQRAMESYEKILVLRPGDVQTAEALVPYYEGAAEHPRLVEVLTIVIASREGIKGAEIARHIQEVYEGDLHDVQAALYWAGRAVQYQPEDLRARQELIRLGKEAGRLEEVVYLLKEQSEQLPEERRYDLLVQAAELCARDLRASHADLAAQLYQQVLDLSPQDETALLALEELHTEAERYQALLEVLQRRLEASERADQRVALKLQIGAVQADKLREAQAAIETYQSILEVDPANHAALDRLKHVYADRGDWVRAAEVARQQLEVAVAQRPVVLYELGQIYQHRLKDPNQAVEAYAALVEEFDGSDLAGRAAGNLEILMDLNRSLETTISRLLEPRYRKEEEWPKLAAILRVLIDGEPDSAVRPSRQRELAEVQEKKLGDPAAAFTTVQQIAREELDNRRAWEELERLAAVLGEWPPVIRFYRELVALQPTHIEAHRRLADLLESKMSLPVEATEVWEQILQLDPQDGQARDALEQSYTALGRTDDLVSLLLYRAETAPTEEETKRHLYRICEVLQEVGRPLEAVEYYQRIFDLDETDERAFEALCTLLDASEDWPRLESLLQLRLTVCRPEEATPLRMQLGALRASELGNCRGAVEVLSEVLVDDPEQGEAARALQEIVRELASKDDQPDLRNQIYLTLETVFETRGSWRELATIVELRLADPALEGERSRQHLALAGLLRDRLQQKEEALVHLSAAWQLDFTNNQVRQQLEELTEELESWEQLVNLYRLGLEECADDPELLLQFHRRLAQISDQQMSDGASAIFHYQKVLESEPEDQESLEALERLYEQSQELSRLVAIREIKAQRASGPERLDLLRKNAEMLRDRLAQPEVAVQVWQQIHEETGGDLEVLQALEELYGQLGSWSELVSVLQEKASLVPESDQRRALYHQAALLYQEQLGDRNAAVEVYRTILGVEPQDTQALAALERLFEGLERWPDLADVLRQKTALTQVPAEQIELSLRLARLNELYLGDRSQAIALYRDVLELEPENTNAVEALENILSDLDHEAAAIAVLLPVYETSARWPEVVRLLERKLALSSDPNERLDILHHIRLVHEERLGDLDAALAAASRHYTMSLSRASRQEVERLASQSGDYQTLVASYYETIPLLESDEEILSALLRVAEVCRDRLGDEHRAVENYRHALELDPANIEALEALEQLYLARENYPALLEVLQRRVEMAQQQEDVPTALGFLHRMAAIHEKQLEDLQQAVAVYQQCLDLRETDEEARTGLERLFRRSGRWMDLVELLYRQIELTEDAGQIADVKYQLGHIYESELGEVEPSVDLWTQVLSLDIGHQPTIQALESLLDRRGELEAELVTRAAGLLEGHYQQGQAYPQLVKVLEIQADGLSPEGAADRLAMAAQVTEEKLGDPVTAFGLWLRVFDLTPQQETVWHQLRRLAGPTRSFERLAARFEAEVEDSPRITQAERTGLALVLGELLERDLGDYPRSRAIYELVQDGDPENQQALDALERLYERLSDWEAMLALWTNRAEQASEDSTRVAYWLKAGRLSEEILADPGAAIAAFRAVLEIQPTSQVAYTSLERIYELEGRHEELVTLYRDRAAGVDSEEEQLRLLYRMGQTLWGDLGAIERAVPVFQSILDIQPGHRGAIRSLEHLLASLKGQDAYQALREEITLILEEIYQPETDWEKLVGLYEARLEADGESPERVALLQKAADLVERYGHDLNRAFELYSMAFRLNPDDTECGGHLDRLVNQTGNYAAVVETYKDGLPRAQTRKLAVDLRLSTSEILETKLINPDAAVAVLEELLQIDSHHPVALARLEKLYRQAGNYQSMVSVLSRRAERASDILERKDLLYEMAKIQEFQLNDLEAAAETLRRVLDLDPEDLVAMETLEVLLRKTGNFDDLVGILMAKADAVESEEKRHATLFDLARVYEHDLGDLYGAIDVYRNLHLDHPEDLEAIEGLDRLYERTEKWGDLLDIIEEQRRLTQTTEQLDALDFRCATLLQHNLQDPLRAVQIYRAILERTPGYTPALLALEELWESEYALQVADVLEPLYIRWGQWEKVVDLLEKRLTLTEDPGRRYVLLREMARICQTQLNQPTQAFTALSRALAERPEDTDALDELETLTSHFDLWDALAGVLDEVAKKAEDPTVRRGLLVKAAEVAQSRLNDPRSAIDRYLEVLEIYPHDRETLEALDALYQAGQDWEALADLLPRRIEIAADTEDAVALKCRLASILITHFGGAEQAVSYYEEILAVHPDHQGALQGLWQLVSDEQQNERVTRILTEVIRPKGDWGALVELLEQGLKYRTTPAQRAETNRQIAEIYERHLEKPRAAFVFFSQAAKELPDDSQLFSRLVELAQHTESFKELGQVLDELRPMVSDSRLKVDLVRQLATLYDEKLEVRGLAEERFSELLELNPGDPQALEALERIYGQQGAYRELWEVLEKRASWSRRIDERSETLAKMAALAEETMGDLERAARSYAALLDLIPDDQGVVEHLIHLYRQLDDNQALVGALSRQADLVSDPEQRANLYCEVGFLAHDKLGDRGRAAEAFKMALNLDPKRVELYQTLEGLYRALADWNSLKALLQARLRITEEFERPEIIRRLALLLEEQFSDLEGAATLYRQAIKIVPSWQVAHFELARLLAANERWEELGRAYQDLEGLLQEDPQANRTDLIDLYRKMSELKERQLNDRKGAAEALSALLELNPTDRSALQQLRQLQQGFGDWASAAETIAREVALEHDPAAKSRLLYQQGQIQQSAGAPASAVRLAWEQAKHFNPSDLEVNLALKELYARQSDYPALWSALLQLVGLSGDRSEQQRTAKELIELARTKIGDQAHLIEALEVAQTIDPEDMEIGQELASAYMEIGAFNRAAPLVEGLIARLGEGARERQVACLEHLQGLVLDGLGDEPAALQAFQRAYKADMNYLPNLMSLGRIQFNQGDLDSALKTFQTMLLHQMSLKSNQERVSIFYHLGEILLRKGDRRRARDMFNRALSIDRNHQGAKRGLAETQ
ncbi:MAG: tetratricopeptide repeat protein [Bradymonadales bacterium]|nr:tetratricopeptide repeat protein [Bradymonadales bacterium]